MYDNLDLKFGEGERTAVLSAVLLLAVSVLTLVTVMLSLAFSFVTVILAAVLDGQLFLLAVYKAFFLVCNGLFNLAVLGPGVLRYVVVSTFLRFMIWLTKLLDYMMYICTV